MAEAEEVITDVARHATIYARALWKRHAKRPKGVGLDLRDVAERLDLLVTAVFGKSYRLRVAEPPAPPNFLRTLIRRAEGPQSIEPLPGTDGVSIWLPPRQVAAGGVSALDRYKALALQQAMRSYRGLPEALQQLPEGLERDVLRVLEAKASDAALARLLPGLRTVLLNVRTEALAARPPLRAFSKTRQPLEVFVLAEMSAPMSADEAPSAQAVQEAARSVTGSLVVDGAAVNASLFADAWTGEVRPPPAMPSARNSGGVDVWACSATAQRSHRLPRTPKSRAANEEEDDAKQGVWMVQTATPHEQVEDPVGMQRPTDREADVAGEELADALSELPEARLVAAPGRTREVFLSEDELPRWGARDACSTSTAGGTTLRFPEWDFRVSSYRPDHATVRLIEPELGPEDWVDRTAQRHRATIDQVRRRFETLRAERGRRFRLLDGDNVDIEAFVEAQADYRSGRPLSQALYQSHVRLRRDVAVFLLVDISGSTDSWVSENRRVVDVEREALLLVCRAVKALAAPFAVGAFSGEGPANVTMRLLKSYEAGFSNETERRIAALEPQQYTRAGAALRYATSVLMTQPARHRLLVMLSDGKPNDIDEYEGRYGVEDMRQAAVEAKLQGVNLFCLTVDRQAARYLPAVFGPRQYALLTRPELLPVAMLDWLQRLLRG
jgi:nitric oxide reductase NorD protein